MYDLKTACARVPVRWILSAGMFVAAVAACLTTGAIPASAGQTGTQAPANSQAPKAVKKGRRSHVPLIHVLVFPPDTRGGVSDELTDVITDVIQSRLKLSGKYGSLVFSGAIPAIRRAYQEGDLHDLDIKPPFDDTSKARRLATVAAYKCVIVSSINDVQFDPDKRQMSVSMSMRIIDLSHGQPLIRAAADTMLSPEKIATDDKDVAAAGDVARKLTEQLINDLLEPKAATPTAAAAAPKPATH